MTRLNNVGAMIGELCDAIIQKRPLRFDDGVSFDLSGPYRIERRFDGLYVVGEGSLTPCKDQAEADVLLAALAELKAQS